MCVCLLPTWQIQCKVCGVMVWVDEASPGAIQGAMTDGLVKLRRNLRTTPLRRCIHEPGILKRIDTWSGVHDSTSSLRLNMTSLGPVHDVVTTSSSRRRISCRVVTMWLWNLNQGSLKVIENSTDHCKYTTFYWSVFVTIALSCTVFELFHVKYRLLHHSIDRLWVSISIP